MVGGARVVVTRCRRRSDCSIWESTLMDIRYQWNLESGRFELLRIRYEHIGRITDLKKPQPSVPRHPINRQEYFAPTELGKSTEEIVHKTGAGYPQHINYELLCRYVDVHHGVESPWLT